MLPSWIRSRNGTPRPDVFLRHADHQAGVGLDQVLLCGLAVLDRGEQLVALVEIVDALGELLAGFPAALHPLGQADLLLGGEQGDPADLLEIEADGVVDVDEVKVDINLGRLIALLFGVILLGPQFRFFFITERADLDALFEEVGEQVFELFHVRFSFREGVQDVVVRHEALIAAELEQLLGGRAGFRGDCVLPFPFDFGLEVFFVVQCAHQHTPSASIAALRW